MSALVGQLAEKIRSEQDISSDDIKGAVNSILAAAKGKLEPDAIGDIEKKLADAASGGEQPAPGGNVPPAPEQPTGPDQAAEEQPMAEIIGDDENDDPYGGLYGSDEEPDDYASNYKLFQNGLILDIIRRAGLQQKYDSVKLEAETGKSSFEIVKMRKERAEFALQICEGLYVFVMDYNENTTFIHTLSAAYRAEGFKPRFSLNDADDLEEEAQAIYLACRDYEEDMYTPKPGGVNPEQPAATQVGGFSLNEAQKLKLLNKLKSL